MVIENWCWSGAGSHPRGSRLGSFRGVSRLESEGMSIVLVEQDIELTLEPVGDIVILDWGSVVLRGAARNLGMNGAIVTQHQGVH